MKIKYQRTSSGQQHGNRYDMDTKTYDAVYFDKGVSGVVQFASRTQGKKVIEAVKAGQIDEITVEEIRDFGRNTRDVINTLAVLDESGIQVTVRSMGVSSRIDGKPNPIWNLVTTTMSSIYEMELQNLKARTTMGRQAYVMNGGVLGRSNGSTESVKQFLDKPKSREIISLLKKDKSVRDISGRLGVSHNLVCKVRKHVL